MINIALFLHIYQPSTQFPEITKRITKDSYKKIIELLKRSSKAKITLNINGSLIEQLVRFKYRKLLADIRHLAEEGKIEFTSSAKYHPLLPKIPDQEIIRQVKLNDEINRRAFGSTWNPRGFFPPEMAYTRRVGKIVEKLGYNWILLEESAFPERYGFSYNDSLFQLQESCLKVFFREQEMSLRIAFGQISNFSRLRSSLPDVPKNASAYIILAMDGETFGYHHPRQVALLEEIFQKWDSFVTISELFEKCTKIIPVDPLTSTWGVTIEDTKRGRIFPRWDNPKNPLHCLQWELYHLALKFSKEKGRVRKLLDEALQSDQFFWAAHDPCWHPEMVKRGATVLKKVILQASQSSIAEKKKAKQLFSQIIEVGKKLYGETTIAC